MEAPKGKGRTAEGVDRFFDDVYRELRALATSALRRQRPDHTLQPTALVHEAWLKLSKGMGTVEGRGHFLAAATLAMRQILTDHARARRADKRGVRDGQAVPDETIALGEDGEGGYDLVAFDDALTRLSALNERHGRIAELRILGGLTVVEVAEQLGVSERTVATDWRFARAWLRSELGE